MHMHGLAEDVFGRDLLGLRSRHGTDTAWALRPSRWPARRNALVIGVAWRTLGSARPGTGAVLAVAAAGRATGAGRQLSHAGLWRGPLHAHPNLHVAAVGGVVSRPVGMSERRPPTEPFRQFCAALNRHGVDYVIVGSEAVAFHGVPRFSVDFDVLVRPTTANLFRVKAALEASGLGDLSAIDPEVWAKSRALLRIGESPLQIDILLQISGIDYHAATTDAVGGAYGEVPVRFLGRSALIKNKRASGRPKDLADVDLLTSDDPDR